MPSREKLLESIRPDMKLTKGFLLNVYAWEMDFPGFADKAIGALKAAGCSNAGRYYDSLVAEHKAAYEAEMGLAAAWYRRECEKNWIMKGCDGKRIKKKEASTMRQRERLTGLIKDLESRSNSTT